MSSNTGFQQSLLLSPAKFPIVLSVMNNPTQHLLYLNPTHVHSRPARGNIVTLEKHGITIFSSPGNAPCLGQLFPNPKKEQWIGLTRLTETL